MVVPEAFRLVELFLRMTADVAVIVGVTVAILTLRRRARADLRREVRNIAERVARRVQDEPGPVAAVPGKPDGG